MQKGPSYKDIATLRNEIAAKDKSDCFGMGVDEAVKLVVEKYQTTEPAAREYIHHLKGITDDSPKGSNQPSLERMHKVWNEKEGKWEDGPLAT